MKFNQILTSAFCTFITISHSAQAYSKDQGLNYEALSLHTGASSHLRSKSSVVTTSDSSIEDVGGRRTYYQFKKAKNAKKGKCLTLPDFYIGNNPNLTLYDCVDNEHDAPNQFWRVDRRGRFHNLDNDNMCIQVLNPKANVPVTATGCNQFDEQRWAWSKNMIIMTQYDDICIDVDRWFGTVRTWNYCGTAGQKFIIHTATGPVQVENVKTA
mmetsp:Transcript_21528/g.43173  ORF Transcript_21528/g.43173 Transcript_21528/m.43173 type:complete len:212 (-) Transcript_21528:286-921(-)